MWDGRETALGTDHCNIAAEGGACFGRSTSTSPCNRTDATQGHAQVPIDHHAQREAPWSPSETAARHGPGSGTRRAKRLDSARKRKEAPRQSSTEVFYYGINDNLGDYRTHAPFTPIVFDILTTRGPTATRGTNEKRRAVVRGQAIFNTRPIAMLGRRGPEFSTALQPFRCRSLFEGTCYHLPQHAELGQPLDRGRR